MTNEQIGILNHTRYRSAYGMFCGDSKDMQELCHMGYMESAGRKSFVPDEYFKITRKGLEFFSQSPKKEMAEILPQVYITNNLSTLESKSAERR